MENNVFRYNKLSSIHFSISHVSRVQKSILHLSYQKSAQITAEDLSERVGNLENEQSNIRPKFEKFKIEITDLQCRSMRDNLIFTGIDEPEYIEGDTSEDAELSLRGFLKHEMQIHDPIQFQCT